MAQLTFPATRVTRTGLAIVAALLATGILASSASASHTRAIGSWALDESGGQTVLDGSGNSNHGTLGSSAVEDESDPAWISGSGLGDRLFALRFGGDDHVQVPDSTTLEPSHITVEARVRAAGSPGKHRYVVSKGALRCEAASYGLYTGPDGGLAFYVSNGLEYTLSPDAGTGVWNGAWHHVAGTFDGKTVRLYVDGAQVRSGSVSSVSLAYGLLDDDRFMIGDYAGPCPSSLGFVGDIDAVRVWNVAMTAGDVALLSRS